MSTDSAPAANGGEQPVLAGFTVKELGFDPIALYTKYEIEKQKRVRADGIKQYKELTGKFAPLAEDTYADPNSTENKRQAIREKVGTVIIGAGIGGVITAAKLVEAKYKDVVILDKAADYGGTWYWNQYPGARCDTESYIYMPMLEETGYIPTEKYVTGREITQHLYRIADKYELRPKTHFQTLVKSAVWDEKENLWIVTTNHDDEFKAKYLVTSTGILHKPKLPGVEGIDSFKGKSFHTSRWDYDYTGGYKDGELNGLKDKRVGIIGTGATSIQITPVLAKYAKELYVFQRTPAAVNVRNNAPTDPTFASSLSPSWQKARQENFNDILAGVPVVEDMVNDGWTEMKILSILGSTQVVQDPKQMMEMMQIGDLKKQEHVRARVDELVKDKKVAESLKAWYGSFCKRPCFHDEYLQAFNLSHVHLVDTDGKGIEKITEKGIVANGEEIPLDLIIYSTGFDLVAPYQQRSGIVIKGRNGLVLDDKWASKGMGTLFGAQTRDFPNYFILATAQTGVSPNFTYTLQSLADHVAYVIPKCESKNVVTIEPTQEAEENWTKSIVEKGTGFLAYLATCTPSYYNYEGHLENADPRQGTYGQGATAWGKVLEAWREKGDLKDMDIKYAN